MKNGRYVIQGVLAGVCGGLLVDVFHWPMWTIFVVGPLLSLAVCMPFIIHEDRQRIR